ncbi:MAG: Flp family type IVb pilin [Schwartzia sp.]|nr:Flp family type IVb pilin [Schwartzia sp. (in: firmicutes)]
MKEVMEYVKARYLSGLSEKGQGIVEYALILAFVVIVAAAITGQGDLKNKVQNVFNSVSNAFGS